MSVIIKDFKLPACCAVCELYVHGEDTDNFYSKCNLTGKYFSRDYDATKRDDDCLLEEI